MIDKIRWVWDRWKVMEHPREEVYRVRQQWQYHFIDRLWYKHPPIEGQFVFRKESAGSLEITRTGLKEVTDRVKDIRSYRLLNTIVADITDNTLWNYDFKNGKEAQRKFVHRIDDFDYRLGEIKYVYELSRLYHVPVLAAYAVASDDGSLADILFSQLRAWYGQNPFLGTIAWKSGNVAGIRAVNLVIYRMLMQMTDTECGALDALLNPLMELHYRFLVSHLSLYSSKGNHHVGELAGLVAICVAYKFPGSDETLRSCLSEMEAETLRLIHPDGFNREQATRYQASYINLIVTSFALAKSRGFKPSAEVTERIRQMYLFLDVLRVAPKEFFHVGDDDNAELVYPYYDKDYDVYESMLNDATVLFGFPKKAGYHFDLRNYILWGDGGMEKYKTAPVSGEKTEVCKQYKDSGYYIVKDERVSLLFDVGRIGIPPTMCHGHSDILHLILYIDNTPILVDCGSYQYNMHYRKMRDYFHGVRSHNTIAVDGLSQAVQGSGMFWLSNPETVVLDYSEDIRHPMCTAMHNGYNRPGMRVTHRRKVEYNRERSEITICDTILSEGQHEISFHLHFHPSVAVKHEGNRLIVDGKVTLSNPLFRQGQLVKGDEALPLGWYSQRYDSIEPTFSFMLKAEATNLPEIITYIHF